jgi:hypothetical protein
VIFNSDRFINREDYVVSDIDVIADEKCRIVKNASAEYAHVAENIHVVPDVNACMAAHIGHKPHVQIAPHFGAAASECGFTIKKVVQPAETVLYRYLSVRSNAPKKRPSPRRNCRVNFSTKPTHYCFRTIVRRILQALGAVHPLNAN